MEYFNMHRMRYGNGRGNIWIIKKQDGTLFSFLMNIFRTENPMYSGKESIYAAVMTNLKETSIVRMIISVERQRGISGSHSL